MRNIAIVSCSPGNVADLKSRLSAHVEADFLGLEDLANTKPRQVNILDIDLRQSAQVQVIKTWLYARPPNARIVVGIDDKASYLEATQACAIGATTVMSRPIDAARLQRMLIPASQSLPDMTGSELSALQSMFETAGAGRPPNMVAVKLAGTQVIDRIGALGLTGYLDIVRKHHVQTYQHCLVVTAVAVAFGSQLGFNRGDTEKLALAGLLHDLGKAKIPIDILEKPAALDASETSTMQLHPALGYEVLRHASAVPYEILDMVLHHHEFLDGSGYPHGLKGKDITDLTRMMTIADVYGALIERRPYRPPLPGLDAFRVLCSMEDKLDPALVRAFAPLAHTV